MSKCDVTWCESEAEFIWYRPALKDARIRGERRVCLQHRPSWRDANYQALDGLENPNDRSWDPPVKAKRKPKCKDPNCSAKGHCPACVAAMIARWHEAHPELVS